MGKRSKGKAMLSSASRRKAVLQIEPVSRRREGSHEGLPVHSDQEREVNPTSISGIGLLGQYADESDDEIDNGQKESSQVSETNSTSMKNDELSSKEVQIESKLDDFFKEIAAISSDDVSNATEVIVDQTDSTEHKYDIQSSETELKATQGGYEVSYPWEMVCDPNTNYVYYWNTVTNEVSWEIPQQTPDKLSDNRSIPDKTTERTDMVEHNDINSDLMVANDSCDLKAPCDVVPDVTSPHHKPDTTLIVQDYLDENKSVSTKENVSKADALCNDSDKEMMASSKENNMEENETTTVEAIEHDWSNAVAEEMPEYPITPEHITDEELSGDDGHEAIKIQRETTSTNEEKKSTKSPIYEDESDVIVPTKKAKLVDSDEEASDEDFAEKLLEEFFDGKTNESKAIEDDMDVDSGSELEGRIEDNTISLLPPEAFQHNSLGTTKSHESLIQDNLSQSKTDSTNENEKKIMEEIYNASGLLMSKLGFLDITKEGLNKLQLVLLQIETRIKDWREGALSSKYLLKRLHEADEELKNYEESAAPKGWTCLWDSSYKRYFYTNNGTGESQWEYPQIKRKVPSQRTTIQAITTTTTIATTAATAADTQDPYRVSDDRGDSTPPLSHVDSIPAPPDNHVIPAPPLPNDDNIMVIPPPPPPPTSAEHSFTPISRPLVDYSDLHEAKNASELSSPRNSPVLTSSTNVKTKKKKSKSSSSTIRTSKVKKMSSLVQKWQSLKKQDEVLSEEESDEEDKKARDVANIQQWKQEQILSGQAENNPNFVEIKGDWRERVRKAKMRSSALTKDGSPNP